MITMYVLSFSQIRSVDMEMSGNIHTHSLTHIRIFIESELLIKLGGNGYPGSSSSLAKDKGNSLYIDG